MTDDKATADSERPHAVGAPVERPVRPHRVPTRAEVERLMKRCQIGVGPRQMGEAHDIMAECYGTLGRQQIEIERLTAELAAMTADRDSWADQASQRTQDAVDLVAKERERCAKLCEDFIGQLGPVDRATTDIRNPWLVERPQECGAENDWLKTRRGQVETPNAELTCQQWPAPEER